MGWSVAFSPVLPLWLIAGLAGIGLLLILFGLLRRVRGSWLRTAALAALVLALMNPIVQREEREGLPTVVAMVVDKSPSQALDGRDVMTEEARVELARRFAEFDGIELREIDAASLARGITTDGTELFGALQDSLADVPPDRLGAVLMLTDGQVHDVPTEGAGFMGGAPLHVLLTGRDGERDRRIVIDSAPRFGIVGEQQTITYRVLDDGATGPPAQLRVTVTADGVPLADEIVTAGTEATLNFDMPHGGQNILEFESEVLTDELTDLNNRAVVQMTGVRENLRVLLVSGEPHPGERTWRDLLKSDAAVDLVHFTILRPPEKQDGTPIDELSLIAFPTRELFQEKIAEFDLIIFDRYNRRGILPLLYFDNIARYVEGGGALLVAGGPDYADFSGLSSTPLSFVLPADPTGDVFEEPFYPEISERGLRHPVTRGLPGFDAEPPEWSRWFRMVEVEPPRGDIVMEGPDERPLLVLSREGEGRVALLLSDQVWLWARGYEGGGPNVDLLRRLSHWLMKEPDLEEEALRATARGSEIVIERQTMEETVGPITVIPPTGEGYEVVLQESEPGLWRTIVPAEEIGLWRVEDGDHLAFAHLGPPNPREFLDARSTPNLLQPLVEESGGRIARMADQDRRLDLPRILPVRSGSSFAGGDWIGVRMTEASVLLGVDRLPLFAGFLGLAILLGALAATWYREGR
ncbi:MAG: hypothetical protein IT535_02680 [Bauldia sp.]|nr:hypothetical protein [Bauldia sp.]